MNYFDLRSLKLCSQKEKESKVNKGKKEKKMKTLNDREYNFGFMLLKIDPYSTAWKPPIVARRSHSHLQGDS